MSRDTLQTQQGRVRIKKHYRLIGYDYSSPGMYFVTITSKFHDIYFGQIKNQQMILNKLGKIIQEVWNEIPSKFNQVNIGESIVMPNHIHGILTMEKSYGLPMINHGPTENKLTIPNNPMQFHKTTLGKIIRWFKGKTCRQIRLITPDFSWQPRYHDRIIRNEKELHRIQNYIINNPKNWQHDRIHKM